MAPASVLVAGGGIGGLTSALALARAGFDVTVVEQAGRFEEVGAGIQLTPNASHVLTDLGLAERLTPHTVSPEALVVRRGTDGSELTRVSLGAGITGSHGAPWWVIHRADLQGALLDAIAAEPKITIEAGAALRDLTVTPAGVTATLGPAGQPRDLTGIGLIGADGLWSATRRALGDASTPSGRARAAWRATLPVDQMPRALSAGESGLWMGADAHLVHYPIRGGQRVNVVAVINQRASGEGFSAPGDPAVIKARFRGWCGPARELIEAGENWLTWPLVDRDVWFGPGRGPVTLLGDAAHPMMPFLAQGGAMAIEDAAVLAKACARFASSRDAQGFALACRAYETARRERVVRVQREARLNGWIYHLGGPIGIARDMVVKLGLSGSLLDRYDWLYRWRP
jgi:salicylate hydroxylase